MGILTCDGYKMFHGTVRITPVLRADGTRWREPFDLTGTWLYKPSNSGYWTCKEDNGPTMSWPENTMSDFRYS